MDLDLIVLKPKDTRVRSLSNFNTLTVTSIANIYDFTWVFNTFPSHICDVINHQHHQDQRMHRTQLSFLTTPLTSEPSTRFSNTCSRSWLFSDSITARRETTMLRF